MIKLNADGSCSGRPGVLKHRDETGKVLPALFDSEKRDAPAVLKCEHDALRYVKLACLVARRMGGDLKEEDFFYDYVDYAPEPPEPTHVQDAAAVLRRVMEGL
jgi:hypothetical protein